MTLSHANRAACACLGYSPDELQGMDLGKSMSSARRCGPGRAARWRARGTSRPRRSFAPRIEARAGLRRPPSGTCRKFGEPAAEYWIVVARTLSPADRADVSRESQAESYGLGLPGHDPLTGLPDRRLFDRRLGRAMERLQRARRLRVCRLLHRPRRLQGGQRQFRASGGRPRVVRGCPAAGRLRSARRHGGAIRRRRVHGVPRRSAKRGRRGDGGAADSRTTANAGDDRRPRVKVTASVGVALSCGAGVSTVAIAVQACLGTAAAQDWAIRGLVAPGRSCDVSGEVARRRAMGDVAIAGS